MFCVLVQFGRSTANTSSSNEAFNAMLAFYIILLTFPHFYFFSYPCVGICICTTRAMNLKFHAMLNGSWFFWLAHSRPNYEKNPFNLFSPFLLVYFVSWAIVHDMVAQLLTFFFLLPILFKLNNET